MRDCLIGSNSPDYIFNKIIAIIDGYQIYHNYFRPRMGLDGKTPAEVCGIEIQGDNKWKTLIQNASRKN